jgi:hypothetical protein
MLRIVTFAAAAAIIAVPAAAQDSIRIPTAGKSVDQVRLEVNAAAHQLCVRAVVGATFPFEEMAACMKHTVNATFARAQDPALRLAQR